MSTTVPGKRMEQGTCWMCPLRASVLEGDSVITQNWVKPRHKCWQEDRQSVNISYKKRRALFRKASLKKSCLSLDEKREKELARRE